MKKARKYSTISFDGTEQLPTNEEEIIKQQNEKINAIPTNSKTIGTALEEKDVAIIDKSIEDRENVIKEFLKVNPSQDFSYSFVLDKFIELISNYTTLFMNNQRLLKEYNKLRNGYAKSHEECGPCW